MAKPQSAGEDRSAAHSAPQPGLRLWPGLVLAGLLVVVRYLLPAISTPAVFPGILAGMVLTLGVAIWWAFASRAPRLDRWLGAGLLIVAPLLTRPVLDETVATSGQGALFFFVAYPPLALAFVACALLAGGLPRIPRRAALLATLLVSSGAWTLARSPGVTGSAGLELEWRWTRSHEEKLLDSVEDEPALASVATPSRGIEAEWPGFRGPLRDGVVRGTRIATDWTLTPPFELWRRPIGPGWSSFAVRGDRFYTQEQRGEDELVSCYDAGTGEPLWHHRDPARFWEAMAGAGPRGTPTVLDGRVYALGATGILNVLDADSGALIWSRNAADDTDTAVPGWGFAGSPLVAGRTVYVALSGRLAAYDAAAGDLQWAALDGAESYSSPHWLSLAGAPQIVLLSGNGASSVDPESGELLWEHEWPGFHSLQPALAENGDLLIATSGSAGGNGTRRLAVSRSEEGWSVEERWTSRGLKPYFNDLVVHRGHAFGFDGRILASIDLETGERNWKGGRYGNGQLMLLRDQDLLLVLSERGELALVSATPDEYRELASAPAIEGKTWNHPVLVEDLLLVRNDHEMAAYRLPSLRS